MFGFDLTPTGSLHRPPLFSAFLLHAQLETLPGTLCAQKISVIVSGRVCNGLSGLFRATPVFSCSQDKMSCLLKKKKSKKGAAERSKGHKSASAWWNLSVPSQRTVEVIISQPNRCDKSLMMRNQASKQSSIHPVNITFLIVKVQLVTYPTEGMAAVLPHADGASVCLVCWLTSSTLPLADYGCNFFRVAWFINCAVN